MAEESASLTSTFSDSAVATELGVGLVPTDDCPVPLRTALRARTNGCYVFTTTEGLDADLEEALRRLDVTILDLENSEQENARQAIISAAKAAGCDGLVLCEGETAIDFEASREAIADSESFTVEAVSEERTAVGRLVGIPAYNESVGIGSTVLAAQAFADEVVVIDDGSADNTVDIVAETDATLIEHERNQGKGRALKSFFDYARESDHDSFVILDGDGQHLPREIPDVVEPIENGEADLVIGSRYLEGGPDETPFHRRIGQQVLDYLTFGSSGTKLSDTQSGFRAFSQEALETLSIETTGMGVESELIATAQDSTLTIEERSIDVRYEGVDGQTLNPVTHGVGVAKFLVDAIRKRQPLLFYGLPGSIIAGLGVVIGLTADEESNSRRLFSSVVLTVAGLVSMGCGLVLERLNELVDTTTEADP